MRCKKVFVVKNFKSPYVEQAIFILRDGAAPEDVLPDAVSEAERIIAGYLDSMEGPKPKHKKTGGKILAACLGLFSFCALMFFLL